MIDLIALETTIKVDDYYCKGCLSFDQCGIPIHHLEEEVKQCPCGTCLVKMVCDSCICADYHQFTSNILRPKRN